MKGRQDIFSELKLRGSYGVTGNALGFDPLTAKFTSGSLGTFYYNGVLGRLFSVPTRLPTLT